MNNSFKAISLVGVVHAAPYDKVFGIGASGHDVYNKDRWTGDNYLGKTINLFKFNYL